MTHTFVATKTRDLSDACMIIAGSGLVSKDEKAGKPAFVAETRDELCAAVVFQENMVEANRFDFNDPVRLIKHISDVQIAEVLPPSQACELIHTQSCRS